MGNMPRQMGGMPMHSVGMACVIIKRRYLKQWGAVCPLSASQYLKTEWGCCMLTRFGFAES